MKSLEKAIILRYIYLTLKHTKQYPYEHHLLLLILIYFNLFIELF